MVSPAWRAQRRRTGARVTHQHACRRQDFAATGGCCTEVTMVEPLPGHDMQPIATAGSPLRMYRRGDPDMPEDYRRFMVKLLKHAHVENNANPHYRVVLANIAYGGLR